jgi:hypothetical protein
MTRLSKSASLYSICRCIAQDLLNWSTDPRRFYQPHLQFYYQDDRPDNYLSYLDGDYGIRMTYQSGFSQNNLNTG